MADRSLAWKIRVTFSDRVGPREYLSPDIRSNDPGWGDELFNRTILRMEFHLPTGHRILMEGMQSYNFFVEATQAFSKTGGARIGAFWFCGRLPARDVVELWRIGDGTVTRSRKTYGQEWGGGPTQGWKSGVPGIPKSMLLKE